MCKGPKFATGVVAQAVSTPLSAGEEYGSFLKVLGRAHFQRWVVCLQGTKHHPFRSLKSPRPRGTDSSHPGSSAWQARQGWLA